MRTYNRWVIAMLCLALLCGASLTGSSMPTAAQRSGLDGTYTLDEAASDNIAKVIDDAVGHFNFLRRGIARGRLRKLNPAYRQVAIASSPNELSVAVDDQPALRASATGVPFAWVGPDGAEVNVSMRLSGGHLVQTFKSADGQRVNDYTLSPDGRTLIMQVTETSLYYGFDQANPRDARRFSPVRGRSDLFSGNIQYKLNTFVAFAFEQGYYRTRAANRTADSFGGLPLFRGIPSYTTHNVRSEFATLFTF